MNNRTPDLFNHKSEKLCLKYYLLKGIATKSAAPQVKALPYLFSLSHCAGKPIKDKAILALRFVEVLLNHAHHQLIAHQLSCSRKP